MPASKALGLYHAYARALERERLAWDHREHLKQQHPLDVATYWEAERAYERANREQVTAWAAWDAERKANEREETALREQAPLPPPPVPAEVSATETLLPSGWRYTFQHPRLGTIGWLLVGPDARQRPLMTAEIDGSPQDVAWLERLALLQEVARVCQQTLSERFGLPVAAPAALAQAQRQVRLCQRLLEMESQAEGARQVQSCSPRERALLQESLESGLWAMLARKQGLRPTRIAQRERELRHLLGDD